jgi:hypothetical protein
MGLRLTHLLNLVSQNENAQLYKVQKLTLRTIEAALKATNSSVEVRVMSAHFPDAVTEIPGFIVPTQPLLHHAAEVSSLSARARLPLIREILDRLKEDKTATHFIFSNLDICLMPSFYNAVAAYISQGHDALIINRRRVKSSFLEVEDLNLLYAEAGKVHTGYDCFVFSRELLDKFLFTDIYIGVPPAGNDIFYNIMAFASAPALLTEKHLTFHVGMDLVKEWGSAELNKHNSAQFMILLEKLYPHFQIGNFPGAGYGFFRRHFKWLMNPTFCYPVMARLDFSQWNAVRRKPAEPELKGWKNSYYEWIVRKINFRDND